MRGWQTALQRLGQVFLGSDSGIGEGASDLSRAQQHLAQGQPQAAWAVLQLLRPEVDVQDVAPSHPEVFATLGVAAAATGRYELAICELKRAMLAATALGDQLQMTAVQAVLVQAEDLLKQSRSERRSIKDVVGRSTSTPVLAVPPSWTAWAGAMPSVAEYVGTVEARWTGDSALGQRGLFASRPVQAGELLLVAYPIAEAQEAGAALLQAVRGTCAASAQTRRRLAGLLAGPSSAVLPPGAAMDLLRGGCDELPRSGAAEAPDQVLGLEEAVARNAIKLPGYAALYGLPSLLNHACDGHDANAVKLRLHGPAGAVAFSAARDVAEGEELRHHYFATGGPLRERQESAAAWGFPCTCRRCGFEAQQLPGTPADAAISSAATDFKERQRHKMRALASASSEGAAAAAAGHWELLQELLQAARSVETAAASTEGWGQEQVGWCLALVQPLLGAALWCVLRYGVLSGAAGIGTGSDGLEHLDAIIAFRCRVLAQLIAAWQHSHGLGFDHLRNLQLLWSAADELRVRVVARAAALPAWGLPAARMPTLQGTEFFQAARARSLRALLEEAGGVLRVAGLLPAEGAEQALEVLRGLGDSEWVLSANQRREDADHRFWRYEGNRVDFVKSLLQDLQPEMHPHFSGAKYDKGGRITLHNDASRWIIESLHGVVGDHGYPLGTQVFRKIALIYYLTKDWQEAYGGCLVDNLKSGPRKVVPEFNSMVCFLVPREHWVTEVAEDAPMRYTVFGWFSDTEPYPPGCPPPLGTRNPEPLCRASGDVEEAEEAAVTSAPTTSATSVAEVEAVREEASARARVEEAFQVRFGVEPADLRLGQDGTPVPALLERLKSDA